MWNYGKPEVPVNLPQPKQVMFLQDVNGGRQAPFNRRQSHLATFCYK